MGFDSKGLARLRTFIIFLAQTLNVVHLYRVKPCKEFNHQIYIIKTKSHYTAKTEKTKFILGPTIFKLLGRLLTTILLFSPILGLPHVE